MKSIFLLYVKIMLRLLLVLQILSLPIAIADENFLGDFVLGKYLLIGKALDSEHTYQGKVEIFSQENSLQVKRVINGETIFGRAAIESALKGDADVLRIRFKENNIDYEKTCLLRGDLDNYARISCYLYQPGVKTTNPGLEALFHDHTAK